MNHYDALTEDELLQELSRQDPNPEIQAWTLMFRPAVFRRANRIAFQLYDFGEFKVTIKENPE